MKPLEEIIRSLGYVDAQGNLNIAEFARFLGKKYSTVHKYVKNERNIGGGFKLELKAKIPTLNLEYFEDQEKPLYISDNVAISQPEPLSGGNLAALEEYRNKCADLQKEKSRGNQPRRCISRNTAQPDGYGCSGRTYEIYSS